MQVHTIPSTGESSAPVDIALDASWSREAGAGAFPPPEAPSPAPGRLPAGASPNEGDDDYRGIVAVLNERWRVIACTTGIQWILQMRRGRLWRGRSFCRSRAVLLSRIGDLCGAVGPPALLILALLPSWIEAGR